MASRRPKKKVQPSSAPTSTQTASSRRGVSAAVLSHTQTPRELRSTSRGTTPIINNDSILTSNTVQIVNTAVEAQPIPPSAPSSLDVVSVAQTQNYESTSIVRPRNTSNRPIAPQKAPAVTRSASAVSRFRKKKRIEEEEEEFVFLEEEEDSDDEEEEEEVLDDLYESESESAPQLAGAAVIGAGNLVSPPISRDHSPFDTPPSSPPKRAKKTTTGTRKTKSKAKDNRAQVVDTEPFTILIWFHFGDREKDVAASSDDMFLDVKKKLAELAGLDVRDLRPLLYKNEKDRSQTSFRELSSHIQWTHIVEWARKYRLGQLNRVNGTPDGWSIKVKETGSKTSTSKGKKTAGDPASIPASSSTSSIPINTERLTLMTELSQKRQCAKHARPCWIPDLVDRPILVRHGLQHLNHVHLKDQDMAKWIDALLSRNATFTSPGPIVAGLICKRIKAAIDEKEREDLAAAQTLRSQAVPATPQFARTFRPTPEFTPQHASAAAQAYPALVLEPSAASSSHSIVPRPTNSPQYFNIDAWLPSLNGRIPQDTTDYTKFLDPLRKEAILSTFELIQLDVPGLIGLGGMARGEAIRIAAWAKQDSKGDAAGSFRE